MPISAMFLLALADARRLLLLSRRAERFRRNSLMRIPQIRTSGCSLAAAYNKSGDVFLAWTKYEEELVAFQKSLEIMQKVASDEPRVIPNGKWR